MNNESARPVGDAALRDGSANLNIQDKDGRTALHLAVGDLDPESSVDKDMAVAEMVKELLADGADPDVRTNYGDTALVLAVEANAPNTVKALLDGGADPKLKNQEEDAPIHLAFSGYEDEDSEFQASVVAMIKALVDNPATDPNSQNEDKETPLHMAVRGVAPVSPAIVELLLTRRDIKPNLLNIWNEAPLHYVAQTGNLSGVNKLLKAENIDPNIRNGNGQTPLDLVLAKLASADEQLSQDQKEQYVAIRDALLKHGATPGTGDKDENTPRDGDATGDS